MRTLSILFAISLAVSAPLAPADTAAPAAVRDGSHDFDFLYGKWRVHNRLLEKGADGTQAWQEFDATEDCRSLLDGLGNEDFYKTDHWKGFVGMSTRLYDPAHDQWSIYWTENDAAGVIETPPVVGSFKGNVGVFVNRHENGGKPYMVRYTWTVLGKDKARWEHAVSRDEGKTWGTDWTMDFTRTAD